MSDGDIVDPNSFSPQGPFVATAEGIVKTLYESNGSLRATLQDTTSPLFQYYAMDEQKTDITLTADVAIGIEVINVSAGHGFVAAAGEYLVLFQGNKFTQVKVKSVATDAITVQAPMTAAFTADTTIVIRGNILMNVDGSGTPVEFIVNLRTLTIPIDIVKVVIVMQHGINVPDDGKFGGLAALTNGMFFKKEDGTVFSFGNYIINQDFRDMGGTIDYTPNAPAGDNSTTISFEMREVFGQVIRLKPADLDKIIGIVRDKIDVAAGMTRMTTSFIGHFTEGEA